MSHLRAFMYLLFLPCIELEMVPSVAAIRRVPLPLQHCLMFPSHRFSGCACYCLGLRYLVGCKTAPTHHPVPCTAVLRYVLQITPHGLFRKHALPPLPAPPPQPLLSAILPLAVSALFALH